jgi:vacuolar protein 8
MVRALTFSCLCLAAEDYAPFNAVWNQPDGGLHTYLVRFLGSSDQTFQHIAVWVSCQTLCQITLLIAVHWQTIVQLLEAEDETLTNNIRSSPILLSLIKQLSAAAPASQDGSPRRGSISDDDDGGSTGESGASEIAALARRILDLTDGGSVMEGLADRTGKHTSAIKVFAVDAQHPLFQTRNRQASRQPSSPFLASPEQPQDRT